MTDRSDRPEQPTSARERQAAPDEVQEYDYRPPVDPTRPLPPGVGPGLDDDRPSPSRPQ
ncbi:hypothetical protein [Micromonospora sp. HUAS LYJ1]|uniref:hypothetical protein n=1 Tax=Micromonospora sp. HUAS LYJ1 TaxID=3061626 RepID=UPI00267173A4|nr:hypothetical protein [Micromonospora sp. HUAS LYJ1]WKU08003.1 hypothetical protein Q2K16_13720 [Micromonospora sp. HUAS LYJ1]